jgi:Pentapeptide repeats (8 copies)
MAIYLIQHRWTRRELAAIEAPSYARALEWAARRGMSLMDVEFAGIELRGAFLAGADLRGSGLTGADLSGCYLRRADLRGADLREARLAHTFLGSADLRHADFRDADLSRADLRGASLVGADLRGADLREARLAHTFLGSADLRHADFRDADLSRADLRGASLVGADLRGAILTCARLEGALCDWRWSAIPAELLRQQRSQSAEGSRLVVALAFHEDPGPWSWLKLLAGYDRLTDWALGTLAGWVRDGDNAPDLLRHLAADTANGRDAALAAGRAATRRVEIRGGPSRDNAGASARHPSTPVDLQAAPRMMWTRRKMNS